jgi:predicted ATPase
MEARAGGLMPVLESLHVKGFKSIRDQKIELRPINILIGINGAGKSNLLSLFEMLNHMSTESLSQFIAKRGHASSFLFYGPSNTSQIDITLKFKSDVETESYYIRLEYGAKDELIFMDEKLTYHDPNRAESHTESLAGPHLESNLRSAAEAGNRTASVMRSLFGGYRAFQFHDTSMFAKVRSHSSVENNRQLMSDGGNLAAYLYMLMEEHPAEYREIVDTIRAVAPFFGGFHTDLPSPLPGDVRLDWYEKGQPDSRFGPHQLPDGLLRFICIATLLLQPEDRLPSLIIIDEPELGLHPTALATLASMLRRVSMKSQVIAATQSASFLDHFDPEDIIVVEREDHGSVFHRLDESELESWLSDYTIGELWQKSVFGGRP